MGYRTTGELAQSRRREREGRGRGDNFEVLFLANPLPMWVYDSQSLAFLEVNDAAVRQYGYTRQEFLSKTLRDIRPGGELPRLSSWLHSVNNHRDKRRHGPWTHIKRDGTPLTVDIESQPLVWKGRSARLVVVHVLTTSADRADQLLAWSHLIERVRDAVLIVEKGDSPDAQPVITYANPAFLALTKHERSQVIDHPAAAVIAEADAFRAPGEGEADYVERELSLTTRSGETLRQPASVYKERSGGERGWAWTVVCRDVRAQQDAVRALSQREEQLSGIVETAMDAIITIDSAQRVQIFNAAAAMFGVTAAEARGEPVERFIPKRSRANHGNQVDKFIRSGTTVRRMGGVLHTLTGLRATGEEFPIEASISKTGDGATALMTVVIRDVTGLKEAEAARRAQLLAEASSRAKTDFMSRMSHELRTPLNAVLGFTQLLADGDAGQVLSDAQTKHVNRILDGGWHLLALINDVLDVARIESGRLEMRISPVSLATVVQEATEMLKPKAAEAGVSFQTEYGPADQTWVQGDPIRLRQAVLNVLSNAIKYNHAGGTVSVTVFKEDGKVLVRVSDTGLGMSVSQLEHLFEPFNRLGRDASLIEGSGIGLYLTRQLLWLMQGDIAIASVLSKGTEVTLKLPASEAVPAPVPALLAGERGESSQLDATKVVGTVLYVEDNPVNFLLVEHMLARWPGVKLLRAETVAEAAHLAGHSAPDVVLLDMRLPDGTGLDVLAALRSQSSTSRVPVIALSASAMQDEVAAALGAGADDYWTKPLEVSSFLQRMFQLLKVA